MRNRTQVHAAGLIIHDLPLIASNFRSQSDLSSYLIANKTVAIANIDTRQLTRLLRSKGSQNGAILGLAAGQSITDDLIAQAKALALKAPSMAGLDLAQKVTVQKPYDWTQTEWALGSGYGKASNTKFHVVAFDFGVKHNILRMLAERGCQVTVVPAKTSATDALALKPDGIFLSNGPGDPEPCSYAIEAAAALIDKGIPTFGICLGHQIMALASGAKTFKMKFGHHGANHPVKDLDSGRVPLPAKTTVLRWTKNLCLPTCAPPMCRCLTEPSKVCSAPTNLRFASRGTPRHRPAPKISLTYLTASSMRWRHTDA
jgi:carbamoyl-phosphate synthase small subunit